MTATIIVPVSFRTCRRRRTQPAAPKPRPCGPTPIARRIALAHHIQRMIDNGYIASYSDAARLLGLSRARLTQVSDLALLAPDIQEAVLLGRCEPRDRHLRMVGRHPLWNDQRRVFARLFPDTLEKPE